MNFEVEDASEEAGVFKMKIKICKKRKDKRECVCGEALLIDVPGGC